MTVCLPIRFDERTGLSPDEREQVEALVESCRAADGFDPCLNFDTHLNVLHGMPAWILAWASPAAGTRTCGDPAPAGRGCRDCRLLVGAASAFAPSREEAEISACVAPMFRRQGIFSALYRGLAPAAIAAGVGDILLVSESEAPSGPAIAGHLAASLARSERRMILGKAAGLAKPRSNSVRLVPVDAATLGQAASIAAKAFGEAEEDARAFMEATLADPSREQFLGRIAEGFVGTVSLSKRDGGAEIHGLGVLPEARGKGYGAAILDAAVSVLTRRGADPIRLEVADGNDTAAALYAKKGFVDEGRIDYWKVPR